MVKRGFIVLAMLALSGVAIALIAGHHPWEGPEFLEITETHGLHLGDLPIVVAWVVGIGGGWWLWRREGQ